MVIVIIMTFDVNMYSKVFLFWLSEMNDLFL